MQPNELCRICGGTGLFLQIFDAESKYYDDIESCLSVKVKSKDGLSQVICHKCVGTLSWCKEFVTKVNKVKKGHLPSNKLCCSCRTADDPLFTLPKSSSEKLNDYFNLNTQKPKSLKICHQCQFSLDCISDLREKANTAQQLSRRGQHLKFQVFPVSGPSVDDYLSSLKNREVEVDLDAKPRQSTKGSKTRRGSEVNEDSSHSTHENGISESNNTKENETPSRGATRNLKSGASNESSTNSKVVEKPKPKGKSDESSKTNKSSQENKTTRPKRLAKSSTTTMETTESDEETIEEEDSKSRDEAMNSTNPARNKRKREADKHPKANESDLNSSISASPRLRKLPREANKADSSSSSRRIESTKKDDEPKTRRSIASRDSDNKLSSQLSTSSKRQRHIKLDDSKETNDLDTDDSDSVCLSTYVDRRSSRITANIPKQTPTKRSESPKRGRGSVVSSTSLRRAVVKDVDITDPDESNKTQSTKTKGAKLPTKGETETKSSKRKSEAEVDLPQKEDVKVKKQKVEVDSTFEKKSLIRGKHISYTREDVSLLNAYVCNVCSKNFDSTVLGKEHELQHDSRYNNFIIKLSRVDLTNKPSDGESGARDVDLKKDDDDDDELFAEKSTKEKSAEKVDFDSLFADATESKSRSSPIEEDSKTEKKKPDTEVQETETDSKSKDSEIENSESKKSELNPEEECPSSEKGESQDSEESDEKPEESRSEDVEAATTEIPVEAEPENDGEKTVLLENNSETTALVENDSEKTALVENDSEKTALVENDSEKTALVENDSEKTVLVENDSEETALVENDSEKTEDTDLEKMALLDVLEDKEDAAKDVNSPVESDNAEEEEASNDSSESPPTDSVCDQSTHIGKSVVEIESSDPKADSPGGEGGGEEGAPSSPDLTEKTGSEVTDAAASEEVVNGTTPV